MSANYDIPKGVRMDSNVTAEGCSVPSHATELVGAASVEEKLVPTDTTQLVAAATASGTTTTSSNGTVMSNNPNDIDAAQWFGSSCSCGDL
jgi:hypothetical protein